MLRVANRSAALRWPVVGAARRAERIFVRDRCSAMGVHAFRHAFTSPIASLACNRPRGPAPSSCLGGPPVEAARGPCSGLSRRRIALREDVTRGPRAPVGNGPAGVRRGRRLHSEQTGRAEALGTIPPERRDEPTAAYGPLSFLCTTEAAGVHELGVTERGLRCARRSVALPLRSAAFVFLFAMRANVGAAVTTQGSEKPRNFRNRERYIRPNPCYTALEL